MESIEYVYGDEVLLPNKEIGGEPIPAGRPAQLHSIRRGELESRLAWNGPLLTKDELLGGEGLAQAGITHKHDNLFRVTERNLLLDGIEEAKVMIEYNDDSQLDALKLGKNGTLATDFIYDTTQGHGLLNQVVTGNIEETYMYDDWGRVESHEVLDTESNEVLYSMNVDRRDELGRIAEQTIGRFDGVDLVMEDLAFTYDAKGQLLTVKRGGLTDVVEYDAKGNRICTHSASMMGCTGTPSVYSDDNLLESDERSVSVEHDSLGRLSVRRNVDGTSTEFDYDLLGALKEYRERDDMNVVTKRVEYANDYADRRVGRKVFTGDTLEDERQYVWANGLQIEAELDGSGDIVSRFVYGLRPNVPELVIRGDKTYRVITDHLGSPVLIVSENNSTDVLFEASYNEWGEQTVLRGDAGVIPFGFAGGLFDVDTGLVRFGAREYDPASGRWNDKDPLLFDGRQANLYRYSHNDPINFQDLNGELPTVLVGAGVGALVGGISGAISGYVESGDFQGAAAGLASGVISGGLTGAAAGSGLGFFALAGAGGGANVLGGLVGDFINLRPDGPAVSLGDVAKRVGLRFAAGAVGAGFGRALGLAAGSPGGNLETVITAVPSILAGVGFNRLTDHLTPNECTFGDEH